MRGNTIIRTLLVLLVLSLFFQGCEKKEKRKNPFEQMTQTEQNDTITRETLEQGKDRLEENTTTIYPATGKNFILTDLTEQRHYISVNGTQLLFKDISQPLVILYFFTPWSLPCKSEVPYLSELQVSKTTVLPKRYSPLYIFPKMCLFRLPLSFAADTTGDTMRELSP